MPSTAPYALTLPSARTSPHLAQIFSCFDGWISHVGEAYPAGEGHDRALYSGEHPILEEALVAEDTLSLDPGFWGIEKYELPPARSYKLFLPPNPATRAYRRLSPKEKLVADDLSAAHKAVHLGYVERANARIKRWKSISSLAKWKLSPEFFRATVQMVAAILNRKLRGEGPLSA